MATIDSGGKGKEMYRYRGSRRMVVQGRVKIDGTARVASRHRGSAHPSKWFANAIVYSLMYREMGCF